MYVVHLDPNRVVRRVVWVNAPVKKMTEARTMTRDAWCLNWEGVYHFPKSSTLVPMEAFCRHPLEERSNVIVG